MKKLFSKDNRLSKIVALWLVFIMMLTPLVSHIGDKKGAKAADVDITENAAFKPTLTLDMSGSYTIGQSDAGKYYIEPSDTVINDMETFYYGGGIVKVTAPNVGNPADVSYDNVAQTGIEVDDVKLLVVSGTANIQDTPVDPDKLADEKEITSGTHYICVYVKLTGTLKDGSDTEIQNVEYDYGLQKVYKLVYKDFAEGTPKGWYKWQNQTINEIGGNWISDTSNIYAYVGANAYEFNNNLNNDNYLGNVKLMMAEEVNNQAAIAYITDNTTLETPGKDDDRTALYKQFAPAKTGKHVAIAAYCNGDTVVAAEILGTLNVDKTPPTATIKLQYTDNMNYGDSWTDIGTDAVVNSEGNVTNGQHTLNKNLNRGYRFLLEIEDPSGIASTGGKFYTDAGKLVYQFDPFSDTWQKSHTLTDNAGNSVTLTYNINSFSKGVEVTDIYPIDADGNEIEIDPINNTYVTAGAGLHFKISSAKDFKSLNVDVGDNSKQVHITPSLNEDTQKYEAVVDVYGEGGLFTYEGETYDSCDVVLYDSIYSGANEVDKASDISFDEVVFDGEAPTVTSVFVENKHTNKADSEQNWKVVDSGDPAPLYSNMDYRLNITVEDSTSKVKEVNVYSDEGCTNWIGTAQNTQPNQYILAIDKATIGVNAVTYYVKASDNAEHISEATEVVPALTNSNSDVVISAKLDNLPLPETPYITNQFYDNLIVNISSFYEIVSVKLVADDTTLVEKTATNGDVEVNQNNGQQKVSFEYDIIPDEGRNVSLKDIQIIVVYNDGVNNITETVTCEEFTYDINKPVVGSKNKDGLYEDFESFTGWNNTGWVQPFELTLGYASGNVIGAPESILVEAMYSISNSDGNVGVTNIIDPNSTDLTVASKKITIPQSASRDGTKLVVSAKDKANNSFSGTQEYIFKVDGETPWINYYNITNVTDEDSVVQISEDTKVEVQIKDNLTVGRIEFTLSKVGSTSIKGTMLVDYPEENTYHAENIRTCKTNLKEIFENAQINPADGKYTLAVTAYDKAGNEVEEIDRKSLTFIVDNTQPVLTVIPDKDAEEKQEIGLYYSADAGAKWEPASHTDGITNVNKNMKYIYRYYFLVEEDNIVYKADGSADINCYDKDGNLYYKKVGDVEYGKVFYETATDRYYIDVNVDDIVVKEALLLTVKMTDKAGLEGEVDLYPAPQEVEMDIKITSKIMDGDKEVSLSEAIKYTDKEYTVVVNIRSGDFINKVEFYNDSVIVDEYTSTYKKDTIVHGTTNERSHQLSDGYYYKEVKIVIPQSVDKNEFFKNFIVKVTDDKGSETGTIGNVFYDNTNPEVKDNDGKDVVVESKWVNTYTLEYWIRSGAQSVESPIVEAKYVLNDGVNSTEVDLKDKIVDGEVKGTIDFSASNVKTGTKVTIYAKDASGNELNDGKGNTFTVKVDTEIPVIDKLTVNNLEVSDKPYVGTPAINAHITDNWTVGKVLFEITYPDNSVVKEEYEYDDAQRVGDGTKDLASVTTHTLETPEGMTSIPDGKYKVVVTVWDKATNVSQNKTIFLTVDNTVPEVTAKISGGDHGAKSPTKNFDGTARDYYYNSESTPVKVELTYVEDNLDELVVTDNGTKVPDSKLSWKYDSKLGGYVATYDVTTEGKHVIKINASDLADHDATEKTVEFVIDNTDPALQVVLNGALTYLESMGTLDLTSNATIAVNETDTNKDEDDFNFKLSITRPDEATVEGTYSKSDKTTFSFSEEADYVFYVYTEDMAGNQSAERQVSFRVDKTAPQLTIGGISDGGSTSNATTVSFTLTEAFWKDATGHVAIYRQAGEGTGETLLKEMDITPTAFRTTLSETLSESGIYRFEFTAEDRVGHTATTSQTFTIDKDAPVVTVEGSENYAKTKEDVKFSVEITDDFYISKKVTIAGTRTDITGKVHDITFSGYSVATPVTTIEETFTEDGVYEISVVCVDIAGNETAKTLHFTIDKTKPEIGDLSAYDGTMLKEFNFDLDLDELISDLTVCDVHMYLNGSEYDGVSDIEDGAYTLLITAEDELGHYQEKEVSFTLDTKAPVFIVTGVEDGEVKNEEYVINISLQLDEDELWMVTLNGKEMSIGGDTCSINIVEKGEYELVMKAKDRAGNEAEQTIKFKYGSESMWWLWLIIALVGLLTVGFIFFIILKKKKEDEEGAKR